MVKDFMYSLRQSFKNAWRNKGMSLASIVSITAMLLILAVFLALSVNVNYLTENVKDEFNTIEVFLLDDASQEDAQNIVSELEKMDGIGGITFISKEKALEEFKERWGESGYLLDGLSDNPLPNSIRIELRELEKGSGISSAAGRMQGVEDVRFLSDEIEKVLKISRTVQTITMLLIAFLIAVSVIEVSNTVKLTVMARQQELVIMKYIGATNWFIRGPMICEGMLIGLVSALIAIAVSCLAYGKLYVSMTAEVSKLFAEGLVAPEFMAVNIIWIFIALGISIGTCGSMISMRKYLKEEQ